MADTFTHKCPNCGGPLLFDPKNQTFQCEYCLSIFTETEVTSFEDKQREAQLEQQPESSRKKEAFANSSEEATINPNTESDFTNDLSDSSKDDVEVFICSSCGAQIVTDTTTAATYCYYCHNPVVLSGRISGKFLPEKLLPFSIEKETAVETFLAWTQKKWFVPKNFFNEQQIDKLTGVYFPYWVVDAKVSGHLNARGTKIRVWRIGDIEYTETKQYDVERQGKISFRELLKNALSKNIQQKMVAEVQPFPLEQAIPFKSQYLAGFQAEKRDIEYEAVKELIENELKSYSESILKNTAVGYTSLTKVRADISIDEQHSNYVLLPIWLVTYRSNVRSKKIFYYAMNGQTGKVSGVLPISYKRLSLFSMAIFLVALILLLLGGWFI